MVSCDAKAILKRLDAGTATEDDLQQLARYNAWRDAERAVVADRQGRINDRIADPAHWEQCHVETGMQDVQLQKVKHPTTPPILKIPTKDGDINIYGIDLEDVT